MADYCESCGKPFVRRNVNQRFCPGKAGELCRKRGQRGHLQPGAGGPKQAPAAPDAPRTALVAATLHQLEEAGRANTYLGQQAVLLASLLEAGAGTPSALAAVSRELRETMSAALRGAGAPGSAVQGLKDEVAAMRAKRRGA